MSDDKYWSGKAWQTGEAWVAVMGAGSWYYNTASSIWTTDTYYRIYSKAMDIVGNEEQIGTGTKFMYDNKAPTNLSIDGDKNNETNSTEYDLVLDAKDSGSGLWKMSFSTDTTSWSEWEDFSTEKNIEITKDDNFIYYRVNDKCGNVADAISFKIDIENKTNDNNNTIPFEPDPDKDSDDDGVPDDKDAFPEDPAASIDSDGDGYPDQWNPGKSAKDSTTGLKLDAYPNDPKKYAKEDIKGRSPTITTQMILAIVVLIIVLVLVSILFMMKPKKFSVSESDSEKMLNNLKEDIIYGKSSMEKEVTGSELRDMYNHNYQVDELSEESSEYIKNLIEESD